MNQSHTEEVSKQSKKHERTHIYTIIMELNISNIAKYNSGPFGAIIF